jgi:hypothetical protein
LKRDIRPGNESRRVVSMPIDQYPMTEARKHCGVRERHRETSRRSG